MENRGNVIPSRSSKINLAQRNYMAGYVKGFLACAARQEEKGFLTSPLASRYVEYQRRTGMFFPKVTALLARA